MRLIALALVASCAHPARPTITGAELYAQLGPLREHGHVTIGGIEVRRDQYLVTLGDDRQVFPIDQTIEKCRGGDGDADVDCTLALLRAQRFAVMNTLAEAKPARDDSSGLSSTTKFVITTLAIAAPLTYEVAECSFAGCKYVFGVPLVLDLCVLLLATGRD